MIKISFLHPEQELITRTQFNFIICVLFSRISVLLILVIDFLPLKNKVGVTFPRLLFCCTTCYFLLSKNIFFFLFYFKPFNLAVYFFPTRIPAVVPIVKGIQTYGFFFIPPNFSEKKTRNFFIPCSYYFSAI
jgi:hypothetical protein